MNEDPKTPVLLAGLFSNVAWIRVRGRATFQVSPQLRAFADRMVEQGQTRLAVDLEECSAMDSTFLGTLTAIALRLGGMPSAKLEILNADARNLQNLRTLGLDQILEVDQDGSAWSRERQLVHQNVTKPVEPVECDADCQRQVIHEAHEALCKANSENVNRFRDVLDFLEQEPAGS